MLRAIVWIVAVMTSLTVAFAGERLVPPTDRQLLDMEKEALGLWITVDPMAEYRSILRLVATHDMAALAEVEDRSEVVTGGLIASLRTTVAAKGRSAGQPMAMFRVHGLGGSCSAVAFPRTFARFRELLREDQVALFRATVDRSRDEPSLLIDTVLDLHDPAIAGDRRLLLEVVLDSPAAQQLQLDALRGLLAAHPGPTEVFLVVQEEDERRSTFRLGERNRVAVGVELVRSLEAILGENRVHMR